MQAFRILSPLLLAGLAGCSALQTTPPTAVHQPLSIRPEPRTAQAAQPGSIFQPSFSRPLFEDRRARFVGDVITINLVEQTQASKSSSANAERNATLSASISALAKVPLADGSLPRGATPTESARFVKAELVRWGGLVRDSGLSKTN